jgi:hypothetical protein
MFKNISNNKRISNNKINNIIKNKNDKMDYDTIKNIVNDNASNIRTSQPSRSSSYLRKSK